MSDLIERGKAYEVVASYFDQIGYSRRYARALINKVPSARPKGENLCKEYPTLFECSLCGASCDDTVPWDCDINFCPNCGAKMKGVDDE